ECPAAAGSRVGGQDLDDAEPLRVAQRVQHGRELEVLRGWVVEGHRTSIRRSSYICYDDHRTNEPRVRATDVTGLTLPAHVHVQSKGVANDGSEDKPAALLRQAREALERLAARRGGRSGLPPRGPGPMNPFAASSAYSRR